MVDGQGPDTTTSLGGKCSTKLDANPSLSRGNTPRPDAKTTTAFTAGAVACPSGGSAQRHHTRGERATWWERSGDIYVDFTGTPPTASTAPCERRWTS